MKAYIKELHSMMQKNMMESEPHSNQVISFLKATRTVAKTESKRSVTLEINQRFAAILGILT